MKAPTEMQLRAMSPSQRMTVRTNAAKLDNELGRATVALIDSLHLPLSSGGMSPSDPLYIEMEGIAWSAEGKAAAIAAVAAGLPALAGLDPLLQKSMGSRYGHDYQGRENAGYAVAQVMRHLGYEKTGEAKLPPGCIAGSGATWRPNKKL